MSSRKLLATVKVEINEKQVLKLVPVDLSTINLLTVLKDPLYILFGKKLYRIHELEDEQFDENVKNN